MSNEQILPCPFCGAEAKRNGEFVICLACPANNYIGKWNTRTPTPTTPPPNTVKVRVAVSVSPRGTWAAAGGSNDDFDAVENLIDTDDYTTEHRLTWITAHVPLPEPAAEVVGEVETP